MADLRELSELKTIRFVEEYEKKEAKAVEPKAEAKEPGAPVEAPKEEPAPEVAAKKPRKRATATKAKPTPKHGAEEDLPASEKTPEEL